MAERKSDPSFGKKPIPVKLDEPLLARIDSLSAADKIGEPRSTVMRMSMRIGVEQLESVYKQGKTAVGAIEELSQLPFSSADAAIVQNLAETAHMEVGEFIVQCVNKFGQTFRNELQIGEHQASGVQSSRNSGSLRMQAGRESHRVPPPERSKPKGS